MINMHTLQAVSCSVFSTSGPNHNHHITARYFSRQVQSFMSFLRLWLTPKEAFRTPLGFYCPFEVGLLEIHYIKVLFSDGTKKKAFVKKLSAGSLTRLLKCCFKALAFITPLNTSWSRNPSTSFNLCHSKSIFDTRAGTFHCLFNQN